MTFNFAEDEFAAVCLASHHSQPVTVIPGRHEPVASDQRAASLDSTSKHLADGPDIKCLPKEWFRLWRGVLQEQPDLTAALPHPRLRLLRVVNRIERQELLILFYQKIDQLKLIGTVGRGQPLKFASLTGRVKQREISVDPVGIVRSKLSARSSISRAQPFEFASLVST